MGVEVAANGEAKAQVHDKENGKVDLAEPVKVGSHTADEQAKGELAAHPPKNVAEEWPEPPQVHYFWIVKYRLYEDPKLKAEIDKIDREVQRIDRRKTELYDVINPKQKERDEVSALIKPLNSENSQYIDFMSEKRNKMKPLQEALGTLRGGPGRGTGLPSSEKELNEYIRGLEYSIEHESMSLKEEKQIVKRIKELEATRPKMIANDQVRAKIQDSLGQKEVIQDQVELLGSDLDGVRKQWSELKAKREQLYAQERSLHQQLDPLYTEVKALNSKKKEAIAALKELRKKRDEVNSCFYQNRTDINKAKDLAAQKDVKALEKFVDEEVEKFMKDWNNNKAFRGDYEKRILMSLDQRQLSRDGRMRNPDEKPLVMTEAPRPSVGKELPKAAAKPQKEDSKPTTKAEDLAAPKVQKESNKSSKESKITPAKPVEEDDFFVVEKPKKDMSKENKIDEAKLKEMKKEEEKEKQRQALERKKKFQERAAAKAAFIAQKEAEKKQKEREKKLKKKEGPATEEEPAEQEPEAELEKIDNAEEVVETSTSKKAKEPRENVVRLRKQVKTRGALPKAILKKKKSANYWLWGGAAAAAAVLLMLLMVGYNYFL